MAKGSVRIKAEKATDKLPKGRNKEKKLDIDESDEEVIIIKKEGKPPLKVEKDESSSSSSESDIEEEPLTSPLPNKRKTPTKKNKKKEPVSSDSDDVFMEAPKSTKKKTPIKKKTPKKKKETDTAKEIGSPKTPVKNKKKTISKKIKTDTLDVKDEDSSDVELPLETPQKALQKSEVIILSDSEEEAPQIPKPDPTTDINNNNNNKPTNKKKSTPKKEKTENKKKRPSLFEVLEPTKKSSLKGKEEEEEEEEEKEEEGEKVSAGKGSKKKTKEKQPNKRRKKTWEDVARFARINFDTPARSNASPTSLSLSSTVNFSISSALDSMQGKKKKGRVMNKLAIPHKVSSLQYLCINVLCNYIECVESFGIIPSEIQNSICALLAKKRKLNTNTLSLFLDPQSTSLNLTNISEMDPISLSRISECSLLRTLCLSGCGKLTDDSLSIISRGCPNIINIKLNGCYMITDTSLCDLIESHPLIEDILIGWITRFTTLFLKTLSQVCSKLRTIAFIQCPQLNDEMLSYLGALSYLENFQLEGNNLEGVTDVGICDVFTSSVELIKSVILKGVPNITDKGLVTMLAGSKQLKLLQIDGMSQLTDNGISHIAERATQLESLSIGRCANLTDPAVGLIATFCGKTLSKLSIEGLHNITKKSLLEIPQYCAFLRELNLSWCRDVDDELCQSLLDKCKNLNKIILWGCHQVTDVMVGLLLKKGIDVVGKDQFLVTTD